MKRLAYGLVLLLACVGCSKDPAPQASAEYVYEPVRVASACIALVEKPTATRALLVGPEALCLTNYLTQAGVRCETTLGERFDLIVVNCRSMSPASCGKLCDSLSESGVIAWILDVSSLTCGELWDCVNSFNLESVHVWMPGLTRWMLVGRRKGVQVKLAAMMDVFTRERMFDDLSRARCSGLPDVLAAYVGTREDVLPAFRLNAPETPVHPELFLTKDVPEFGWIAKDGVDRDIAQRVRSDVRSVQVVRRLAVKGGMAADAAREKENEQEATSLLERALKRNPDELFVRERLDRLDRNARGFLEVGKLLYAMKCYETMLLIDPKDIATLNNFGLCLRKIGKLDLAEKIQARVQELLKRQEGDGADATAGTR